MKVAYLTHIFSYGGATISLQLLNKEMHNHDLLREVYVVDIIDELFIEKFRDTGASVCQVNIKPIYNFQYGHVPFLNFLFYRNINYKKFVNQLVADGIDVLHVNSTVFPHIVKQVKKYSNIKVVTHIREMLPVYRPGVIQNFIVKNIYKYSDAIIAISDNEANYFKGHPNLHIIPNPVEIHPAVTDRKQQRKIGMVANMSEGKGHFLFLESIKLLQERLPSYADVKFYIVGSNSTFQRAIDLTDPLLLNDQFERKCYDYIKANNLQDIVEFIPYTTQVSEFISDWTLFVRPSLSADPWGRDIIEAMALGLPVVATGSSEFFVQSGENGLLVPEINAKSLSAAIHEVFSNESLQDYFRKNNVRKIKEMCSIDSHANSVFNVYKELVHK